MCVLFDNLEYKPLILVFLLILLHFPGHGDHQTAFLCAQARPPQKAPQFQMEMDGSSEYMAQKKTAALQILQAVHLNLS